MLDHSVKEIKWNLTSTAIMQLCTWTASRNISFGGRPDSFLEMQEIVMSKPDYPSETVLPYFSLLCPKTTASSWQCNPSVTRQFPEALYNFLSLTIKESLQDFLVCPEFDNYPHLQKMQFLKVQFLTQVLALPSAAALTDVETACTCNQLGLALWRGMSVLVITPLIPHTEMWLHLTLPFSLRSSVIKGVGAKVMP